MNGGYTVNQNMSPSAAASTLLVNTGWIFNICIFKTSIKK
jgi:hypothetical protein